MFHMRSLTSLIPSVSLLTSLFSFVIRGSVLDIFIRNLATCEAIVARFLMSRVISASFFVFSFLIVVRGLERT